MQRCVLSWKESRQIDRIYNKNCIQKSELAQQGETLLRIFEKCGDFL